MKKIFIALVGVILFTNEALAQKELLSFNEQNKYMYYQVVDMPGLSADTLQDRAIYFLKSAYPKAKILQDKANNSISGSAKFLVVSGITLVKHQDGEMDYTFNIECKDHKYRYWLTDFTFIPYKTDRYGNAVPELGIEIPLETGTAKLDKKQLDDYLSQSGFFSKQFGDKLKQYMINAPVLQAKDPAKKVISTKDW